MSAIIFKNHWGYYTRPILVTRRNQLDKPWFVQFYFSPLESGKYPTSFKPKQIKGGINLFKTLGERKRAGKELLNQTLDKLENHWHPWEDKFHVIQIDDENLLPHEKWLNKTIEQALADAYDNKKKSLSDNSLKDYRLAVDYFTEAAYALNLQEVKIKDVRKSTLLTIYEAYAEIRSAPDRQYNKNLGYIKSLFTDISDYCDMDYSPAARLKEKECFEGEGYIEPTDKEMAAIRAYLEFHESPYYRQFFSFLEFIYQSGIRPHELLAVKIGDINFTEHKIKIVPTRAKKNSKTKKIRPVIINDYAWQYIKDLKKYPVEYFVFGSPGQPGRGWTGVKNRSGYFLPNATRIKRDTVTKLWHKTVKVDLGFKCDMYALKHKGGDDKHANGVSIDAIQDGFGHSEKRMTKIYLKNRRNVYEKELLENATEWPRSN